MELRIVSPTEDGFLKEIQWNYEEIKAEVAGKMQEYTGLVYTEETIKEAKADRAKLNKFRMALEDARKAVKKKCMEPYTQFEKQVKEVLSLIDEPIGLIDSQIKEVEEARRVEKKGQIMDLYEKHIGSLRGLLPFPHIFREEWLNTTKSLKSIEKEIQEMVAQVNRDMDTIEALHTKYERHVVDYYIRTLDLAGALQENARLEEQEKLLLQRQEEEKAQKQAEEAVKEAAERGFQEPAPELEEAALYNSDMPASEKQEDLVRYVVGLEISGTRSQLQAFQDFLNENGILYHVTEKARRENGNVIRE